MAKTYRRTGSLVRLIEELNGRKIFEFNSIEDIRAFRAGYRNSLKQIKEEGKENLRREITDLETDVRMRSSVLDRSIEERRNQLKNELAGIKKRLGRIGEVRSAVLRFFFFVEQWILNRRAKVLEHSFEEEVRKPFKDSAGKIKRIQSDIRDRKTDPEKWANLLVAERIERQENLLSIFKEHRHLFYGAEGEERVARELSTLPDTYSVIHDYRLEFSRPMYDRHNDDRIHSIQVDHLVVGPTGLYLVETKNWSRASMENLDLFSPIRQLRRSSFALFVSLNQDIRKGVIDNLSNHWGNIKVSPKCILCVMDHLPDQEFQYVKTLSVHQIARYIRNQKSQFDKKAVDSLVDNLLSQIA